MLTTYPKPSPSTQGVFLIDDALQARFISAGFSGLYFIQGHGGIEACLGGRAEGPPVVGYSQSFGRVRDDLLEVDPEVALNP